MAKTRIEAGKPLSTEWPTLGLTVFCYLGWALTTTFAAEFSTVLAVLGSSVFIALHSSLQHEVIHGHPLTRQTISELLIFPALGLFIPYYRYKDTHLRHHYDPNLTDPYEDPESNYLDPAVWSRLSRSMKVLFRFNNSLMGRMLVGPVISQFAFMTDDWRAIRAGEHKILWHWLHHAAGSALVFAWLWLVGSMPIWAYVLAAYFGISLLKIRSYLEHRAHERPVGRTVVVNDRGLFALLFLNNNFHLVHHMNPSVAWYRLPKLFDQDKERYMKFNESYLYDSYVDVFVKYFFRPKDPVPHPIWPDQQAAHSEKG